MDSKANILIPCAGSGSRFQEAGYDMPKPLIDVGGKSMIQRVIENLYHPDLNFIFCVRQVDMEKYKIDELLRSLLVRCTIIPVNHITQGPACTCLLAAKYIIDRPLIIINSDQIIRDWNYANFIFHHNSINRAEADAYVGIFNSDSEKNSYAEILDDRLILKIREKELISQNATTGFHFWKDGYDFVWSAQKMIRKRDCKNGEFYISHSFNYLVKVGKKVRPYFGFQGHYPIGTPEDLRFYCKKFFEDAI